jgi:sortase A
MPPVRARQKLPALRWIRWLLLMLSIVLLGYVGFSLADADVYQAYENWRLNRLLNSRSSSDLAQSQSLSTSSSRNEVHSTPAALGSALGRIEISRIGVAVIIAEGTDEKTLQRAVGHIIGTALPGEQGNVALAGHRDTFFRELRNIRQDDEVTLTTPGGSFSYRVDSIKVVAPENTAVLNDSGESILTLVTCYPFYFVGPAPKRFVVRAHRT